MDGRKSNLQDKKGEQNPKTNCLLCNFEDLSPTDLPLDSPPPQQGTGDAAGADGNAAAAYKPIVVLPQVVPKIDFKKLLAEIALKNDFEVTYMDMEEKTFEGECQCMVQLTTFPIGVCSGRGATAEDARIQGAENALEYLKTMNKLSTKPQ